MLKRNVTREEGEKGFDCVDAEGVIVEIDCVQVWQVQNRGE